MGSMAFIYKILLENSQLEAQFPSVTFLMLPIQLSWMLGVQLHDFLSLLYFSKLSVQLVGGARVAMRKESWPAMRELFVNLDQLFLH